MADVLTFTDRGIYCPAGDFYIDPWQPVDRALITHGHSAHARPGMGRYLATTGTAPAITKLSLTASPNRLSPSNATLLSPNAPSACQFSNGRRRTS